MTYGQPNSDGSANTRVVVNLTKGSQVSTSSQPFEITPTAVASAAGVGRMFNLPRDVIITVTPGAINIRDQIPNAPVAITWPLQQTPVQNGLTMADFNGDGFADFVIAMTNPFGDGFFQYVTAKDVNDPQQGLIDGPGVSGSAITANGSITSGDLDGDGVPEVIVAYPMEILVAIDIYRFSSDDLRLEKVGTTSFNPAGDDDYGISRVVVVAGNLAGATPTPSQSDSGPKDQLAVVAVRYNQPTPVNFYLTSVAVDIDESRTLAAQTPVAESTVSVGYATNLANAKAARLDWQSNQDQIVIGYDGLGHNHLALFNINSDLTITKVVDS